MSGLGGENGGPRIGMEAIGSDGIRVGEVRELGADDFRVHRPVGGDALVRRAAVAGIDGERIILSAPAGELIERGLMAPADDAVVTVLEEEIAPEEDQHVALAPPETPLPPPRWREETSEGMRVLTSDGVDLGSVKLLEAERFLIDRPRARDIWMPASYVDHVGGGAVILQLSQQDVDTLQWEHPPLV